MSATVHWPEQLRSGVPLTIKKVRSKRRLRYRVLLDGRPISGGFCSVCEAEKHIKFIQEYRFNQSRYRYWSTIYRIAAPRISP